MQSFSSKQILKDPTLKNLIWANLSVIVLGILFRYSLIEMLWVYWGQSVVIGYFNFRRILALKTFSTENFKINDRSVSPTKATKTSTAFFFLFHFGFFHFVYSVFLSHMGEEIDIYWALLIFVNVLIFYFNHRSSFVQNVADDLKRCPNIGTIMFLPYARIVPMHLIIIAGGALLSQHGSMGIFERLLFVAFCLMKTVADIVMHYITHKMMRKDISSSESVNIA